MSKHEVDKNLNHIRYLLELIDELNQLLADQKHHLTDRSILQRYESMKKEFQEELNELVRTLSPEIPELAIEMAA